MQNGKPAPWKTAKKLIDDLEEPLAVFTHAHLKDEMVADVLAKFDKLKDFIDEQSEREGP